MNENPHREVEFGFHNGVTEKILKGIREEKYDVGFCSMKEGQKDLEFFPVAQEKLIAAVPLGHPLASRGSVEIAELAVYPQIFFNEESGLRPVIDQIFKEQGEKPDIRYMVDEDSALVGLVAKGFGVGIVPDVPAIRSMRAAFLEIENLNYRRLIYMVTCKNKYLAPIAKDFIDYVKSRHGLKK